MNRRNLFGGIAASILALGVGVGAAAAEDDTIVTAGNGGTAIAQASVGGILYDVSIVHNSDIPGAQILEWNVVMDGGTAIADASGGSGNIVFVED